MADSQLWSDTEWRAAMSTKEINDLPDSDFAYIEPGGEKDDEGKTTPRSLRHYPIHDAAHVRNALARAGAAMKGDDDKAKEIAEKAMPKIKAAAKNEGKSADRSLEWRRKRAEDLGTVERRCHVGQVELREDLDGSIHFTGYASTTNTPYDMGWYTEQIGRGAFKKTLAENPDVVLNLNHGAGGSGLPIARTKAGNLRLSEDRKGLRVEADLDPQDPDVQLLARKMTSGNLDGQMSFAFRAIRQVWNDDYTDREIQECDIHRGDVSVVTQGANPTTSSAIRSWGDVVMEMRSRVEEETRVGKTISKDTAAQIQAAIDALSKLLESGQPKNDEDKGSSEDDPAEGDEEESLALPPFDRRAERARLEARRYPNGRVA